MFFVYYFVFKVLILKLNLKTPGREKIKSPFIPYSQLDPETNTFREDASSTKGYYVMPPYDG